MIPKILLIYTGGTIGMVTNKQTGALQPFTLNHLLKQIPNLNTIDAQIDTLSTPQPKDSSNITPTDWSNLGQLIFDNYKLYNGFVILHGTDTMSYTASAISYMFQNLEKPIIFTGSQLPAGTINSDAENNIIQALKIALLTKNKEPLVKETAIFFHNKLLRANRSIKINSENFDAFASPNFPALITYRKSYTINNKLLLQPKGEFQFFQKVKPDVFVLKFHPGITEQQFNQLCDAVTFKVLILETYGSGTLLSSKWFLNKIKKCIECEIIVINCSQCYYGTVKQGTYETSEHLKLLGVLSAKDMTTEAAITKSMHLLGKQITVNDFKTAFIKNFNGDIS